MRDIIKYGDYTGFFFNGIHCSQFGLVRVSNGSRYEGSILPSLSNITQDGSAEGQHYFGKKNKTRTFSISTAFDSVTEEELKEIKLWLSADMAELIFDERPYIKYYCTLADAPIFNYIAFNEYKFDAEGNRSIKRRVYKGELTFTLVSFDPYGYSVSNYLYQSPPIPGQPKQYNPAYADYQNIEEWAASSKLADLKAVGYPEYSGSGVDGYSFQVYNGGDVPMDIIITAKLQSTITPADTFAIKRMVSRSQGYITVFEAQGLPAGGSLIYDTAKNMLYCNGKVANNYIVVDNFFKIPVPTSNKDMYQWITMTNVDPIAVDPNTGRPQNTITYEYRYL